MDDVRCRKLNTAFSLETLDSIQITDKKKLSIAQAMSLAIYVAYKGASQVAPNPLVGCVILDQNGYFLSKGYHEYYGGAHAEINAIKNLSAEQLSMCTVIVTLEPCAHVGKTGSCADALKDLPIKQVIYGVEDPNPLVSGKGAQILKQAGKDVFLFSKLTTANVMAVLEVGGHLETIADELEILAENFFKNYRLKKPFVALKWAQSLDGKIALPNFESQWITNEKSRRYAHYLRSIYDVTIVGAGTVLKDNPRLNIRLDHFSKENKILVIDPHGAVLKAFDQLNISKTHKKENIYFATDADMASEISGRTQSIESKVDFNNIFFLKMNEGNPFNLEDIHQFCFDKKMKSILVEGGSATINQYFKQKTFDRVYSFVAPIFLGNGLGYSDKLSIRSMTEKLTLSDVEKMDLGDDILITGRSGYLG